MVADEDAEARSQAIAALEEAGYETMEVATGEEALQTAKKLTPRLVILDVDLPGLCGYEVLHRLRHEFGSGLPVVLVSGTLRRGPIAGRGVRATPCRLSVELASATAERRRRAPV